MIGRDEILKILSCHDGELKKFGVKRIGIFGSVAQDSARPDSDMDVLVEFDKKSFDAYIELKIYLEDLFNRKIDLVIADTIKPRLKQVILREVAYATGL